MNREWYMKVLKKRLRHLPKADFERAVEYYEEYFNEAGPEGEQQAIFDLGTPEEAAEQIIMDLAVEHTKQPAKNVKKGVSAVWVGILGVFAAPIALPVILLLFVVVLLMVLVVVMLLFAFMVISAALVISAPAAIIGSLTIIGQSIPAALVCLGYGLIGLGAGLLAVYGMYVLMKLALNGIIKLIGNIVKRGRKK